MLLLIDAGNTRIKWALPYAGATVGAALTRESRWQHSGSVERADIASLADAWRGLGISQALISNVAGKVLADALQEILKTACGDIGIVWFASQGQLAGIRNGYRNPAQLGCDRFASAIGAHALFPARALIVATCGTATTVDAVSADGHFSGGMILPGLGVMAASLALNTAQLPQIKTIAPITTPFADNTVDAIITGCIAAQTGAIERAAAAQRQLSGDVLCVLAGGAGAILAPYLAVPHETVDNLVLIGLHVASVEALVP